uniref:SRP-alpha_N domain-containing protein n=1 Tax=Heterorhabditis bacteriophora TaxID=37862 RepID=A0A1I7WTW0_HETBA
MLNFCICAERASCRESAECFTDAINAFIKDVLIQERAVSQFRYNDVSIKFRLDNEFELVLCYLTLINYCLMSANDSEICTKISLKISK